ncbi:MAG: DUF6176 family protein [Agriterribacter sp.]
MFKTIIFFTSGIFIGCVISYFIFHQQINHNTITAAQHRKNNTADALRFPLKATLYRFEMNDGKMAKFNEWMKWHCDAYDEIITTLEREKMYAESIFRDTVNQPGILYWLTIDGEGGAAVTNSPLKIDSVHNKYMKEVIKKGSRTVLKTEFYLIPGFLKQAIAEHQLNEK